MLRLTFLLCCCLPLSAADPPANVDRDRDGLPDSLEQALALRFTPSFFVSANDCAGLPAEFLPGSPDPRVIAENGSLYSQVFRRDQPGKSGVFVEIHYYHLWSRDCGRPGHALDAEHVSTLVRGDDLQSPSSEWKAVYWFSSAHQDTLCDASSATRAASLLAEAQGPKVWVSRDKHASFFTTAQCSGGCGGDHCESANLLDPKQIIPIGEPGALLNSAVWINSPRWRLAAKMTSDFSESLLAQLDNAEAGEILPAHQANRQVKAIIRTSDTTADAALVGPQQARSALARSAAAVGKSLREAKRAATGWFPKTK